MDGSEKWVQYFFRSRVPLTLNSKDNNHLKRPFGDTTLTTFGLLSNDDQRPRYEVLLKITSSVQHLGFKQVNGTIHLPEPSERLNDKQLAKMDKEIGQLVEALVQCEPNPQVQTTLRQYFIDELGDNLRRSDQVNYDKYLQRQQDRLPQKLRRFAKRLGAIVREPEPAMTAVHGSRPDLDKRRYSNRLVLFAAVGLATLGSISSMLGVGPDMQERYRPESSRPVQEVSYQEPDPVGDSCPYFMTPTSIPASLVSTQSPEYVGFQQQKPLEFVLVQKSDHTKDLTPTTLHELARSVLDGILIEQEYPENEDEMILYDSATHKNFRLQDSTPIFSSEPEPPFQGYIHK